MLGFPTQSVGTPTNRGKAPALRANPPGCESKEDAGLKPSTYIPTHSPGNKLVSRLFPSITDGVNRRQLLGSKQAKASLQRPDHNHENQQNQRCPRLETTRRCSCAAAGPHSRRARR